LRTRIEAAVTEAATAFERRSGLEYARLHRELFASFGTEQRLREANIKLGVAELVDNVSPALPVIERDWSSVAAAGVVAGAATGVAVGTAVGGAGLALLAAGPVGWLIGFGLGAVFGGAAGAAVTSRNLRDRLQPEHRDQIARELERSRTALAGRVDASVDHWVEEVVAGLESLRLGYYAEKHRELDHLRSVIADAQGRDRVVEKVRRQRERLEAVLKS
jgi:hypothetical protein